MKSFDKDKTKTDSQLLTDAKTKVLQSPIKIIEETGGLLLGVCTDPKLVATSKDVVLKILDDGVEVGQISKNNLITACEALREGDRLKGITYSVPLFVHAVNLEYRFQNNIHIEGDISGLTFYFKK